MNLSPTQCPSCNNQIVRNNIVRSISLLEVNEDGTVKAKCKRCKTWVSVPLVADFSGKSMENLATT